MNENTVLRLGFTTDLEKTKLLTVKAPADGLDDDAVIDAMNGIIQSGVLSKSAGDLEGRKFARLVKTEVTEIDLTA